MSNLTDLLPAGAGGKQVSFVASGTLASGQTVALNSDGTVSVIPTAVAGSEVIFESGYTYQITTFYDPVNEKLVVFYKDADNSFYGTGVVGTISGNSISFGTPVVVVSEDVQALTSTYHTQQQKIVLAWYTNVTPAYRGSTAAGSVSGTSLTFGSAQVFEGNQVQNYVAVGYDSSQQQLLYAYLDDGGYKAATVASLSGTTFSFGSKVRIDQNGFGNPSLVQDQATGKLVAVYNDNSSRGKASIVTISGTTPSFGTEYQFSSSAAFSKKAVYDSSSNKIVIAYRGASNYGQAVVATVSGSTITYGTVYTFNSSITNIAGLAFDSGANKVTVVVSDQGDSNYGKYAIGEVSGTSISFDALVTYTTANGGISTIGYDPNAGKNLISFSDYDNSNYGTSFILSTSNLSDFIGITDAAISDTASGSVTIKGGVATNNNLIADSISANTAAAFETGNASLGEQRIVYDTANNKAVVLYADTGNSTYLTAVVGTVSGAAISFGTPVVLQSNEVGEIALAYDANAQKVVAAYKNNAVPFPGRAKVGTVSGTSISFGSAVDFHTGSIAGTDATYDSTSQKVILSYGSSAGGHLIVGTISGTSISFGTEYDFTASAIDYTAVTYDTNAQKVVLAYTDSGNSSYGTAAVGTVSGTSISVGSATVLTNFVVAPLYVEYEPVAQKTVVAYANRGVSPPDWSARVGTVSGTTISFGTETAAGSSGTSGGLTFDTSTGYMIQAYQEASSGTSPVTQISTVSGTDITFGGSLSVLTSEPSAVLRIAYDPDTSQIIGINKVDSSSSVGRTFNVNQGLTPNQNYYVQTDGTLSTTTSTVLAGKALSSTSINLDYTT